MIHLGDDAAAWVEGHVQTCDVYLLGEPEPCTCGNADLKVYAWPAPAGEGVQKWAKDGGIYHMRKLMLNVGSRRGWTGSYNLEPVDDFGEDAPIREAWEKLCEDWATRPFSNDIPDQFPPDGLYLFVTYPQGKCGPFEGSELLPVEDVKEAWRDRKTSVPEMHNDPEVVSFAAQLLCKDRDAQALRFTAPGKEPVWYQPTKEQST